MECVLSLDGSYKFACFSGSFKREQTQGSC